MMKKNFQLIKHLINFQLSKFGVLGRLVIGYCLDIGAWRLDIRQRHRRLAFTLIELLVVITIIGILITLITVAIRPIQIKSRDARRKADVGLTRAGLDLFKSDFKIYPNYTFYLGNQGTSTNGAFNSNLGLQEDIPTCNGLANGDSAQFTNPSADPTTPQLSDTANGATKYTLRGGFDSLNHFLICLKYMDQLAKDPSTPTDAASYQYRVSFDYSEMVVSAKLENLNDVTGQQIIAGGSALGRYYEGNGKNNRQLDDDSDTPPPGGFYALIGSNSDGKYLYQCTKKSDGNPINLDDRSSDTYQPVKTSGATWIINSACLNNVSGLQVIQAFGQQ